MVHKTKPAYYVGEVIRTAPRAKGEGICDVIAVQRYKTSASHIIHIKNKKTGKVYREIVDDDWVDLWELIQPVKERLWNL